MTASSTSTLPKLEAKSRVAAGKSEARRLRRSGLVPAVAYGKGFPSTAIAVPPKEVAAILRSELGKNTVLELALDGKKLLAMIRDFALHPVQRSLEHVDFVEVKLDRPVDVAVPLIATGKAAGVAKGGVLRIVYRLGPGAVPSGPHPHEDRDRRHPPRARRAHHHAGPEAPRGGDGAPAGRADARRRRGSGEGESKRRRSRGQPRLRSRAQRLRQRRGAAAPAADAKKDDKKDEKKK